MATPELTLGNVAALRTSLARLASDHLPLLAVVSRRAR